ncbi:hypothetical protein ACFBZI_02305 [Moraxella sp. ZJ142]|uniref:hypothetical protein n=1 Tax=Moraxella marmotae TaxID=3344520 RepID=UPI0035D4881C
MRQKDLLIENIFEFIENIDFPKFSDLKIHKFPEIPNNKLINAVEVLNKNGYKISHKDVILLIDDTLFGSAKDFFLMTHSMFFCKELMQEPIYGKLSSIRTVSYHNRTLHLYDKDDDSYWECTLSLPNKNNFPLLSEFLTEVINERNKIEFDINYENELKEQLEKIENEKNIELENQAKKEHLRKLHIDFSFEDTSDEILSRVNNLFKLIKNINESFNLVFVIDSMCDKKLNAMFSELTIENYLSKDGIYLLIYSIIYDYHCLESEYSKMLSVSEIIEKNKEIIVERLSIANEYISSYKKCIEFSLSFMSKFSSIPISKELILDENSEAYIKDNLNESIMLELINSIDNIPNLFDDEADKVDELYEYDDEEIDDENIIESEPKANTLLADFLSKNSDGILAKLKNSGILLTTATLNNDESILKIAGVIYNLLPLPIRFVVSLEMLENILLNNRHFLIDKLSK